MNPTVNPSATDAELAQSFKSPSLWSLIVSLWPSILLNGVCVVIVYQLVKHFYPTISDVIALALSGVPAVIGSIITLIRQRSVDVLGAFTLITIVASIILTFWTANGQVFLIRESALTVIFGIICLISLLFPKPIWYYIIRYFTVGNNQEQMVAYEAAWKFPSFRGYIRTVTILWGTLYTIEFLIRLTMIYTLTITQVLVFSSIVFYALTILASVLTFRLGARLRKRSAQNNAPQTHAG